ncbi:MAG: hypothetical protein KGV46_00970, partial [Pasteurella sp.]|nr:hypothetical protein [Pasteurella sp.]
MNLKNNFSTDIAKKIFGNKDNAISFLLELQNQKGFNLPFKEITRGKNKGQKILNLNTNELWASIVKNWDFKNGEQIIRNLFIKSKKYKSGKKSYEVMQILLKEWQVLQLGDITWPFSQGDFDGFVQRVNSESILGTDKDKKVKDAAV